MIDRLISAVMAISLAFLVWLYARGREQETLDSVPVAVQLSLAPGQAEDYDLEITGPSQVLVSFTGPPSRMRELRGVLQRGELRVELTLAVPEDRLHESRFLDTVRVEPEDIHAPPGVTPVVVEGRNRIPVTIHRLVERRLPVRLDSAPEDGEIVLEPSSVLVRGPQDILERARFIATQPCVLPLPEAEATGGRPAVATRRVALVHEMSGRPVHPTPALVAVRLTVRPRQKLYELHDVPVRFLCPTNFALRARFVDERSARITLRVRGPAADVPPRVTAYVDLTADSYEPGLYGDEPVRLQLPPEFQLVQDPPRCGAFRLDRAVVRSRETDRPRLP